MDKFDICVLWSTYKDRLAYNPDIKLATFESKESARSFKDLVPDWTVQYRLVPGFDGRIK